MWVVLWRAIKRWWRDRRIDREVWGYRRDEHGELVFEESPALQALRQGASIRYLDDGEWVIEPMSPVEHLHTWRE